MVIVGILFSIFVGLGFIAMGIIILLSTLSARNWGIKSKSWTTVEGVITSTKIVESYNSDQDGSWTSYKLNMSYSYKVGSVEYTSNRISFDDDAIIQEISDREGEEERLKRYPKGRRIRVYYNPEEPQQSTIKPGFRASTTVCNLVFGLLAIGLPLAGFFLWLHYEILK